MEDTSQFRKELLQSIKALAAQGEYSHVAFVTEAANLLVEAEELSDYTVCSFRERGYRRRELLVDGFLIDDVDLDASVSLIVADYRGGETVESLTVTQASTQFDRALHFVEDAIHGRLHEELEPSTPAADLATWLYENQNKIGAVRLYLVSDAALSARSREPPEKFIGSIRVDLHIWDIVRFQRAAETGGREPIEIDLTDFMPGGLPALPASLGSVGYDSYLCVVPGNVLAELYDRYGSRLLEGNVRSFLNVTVAVNRGIRRTIRDEPERFFAYNNGVTATALHAEATRAEGETRLTMVRDLQIVNGGQTTASLYSARRRDHADLSKVFVQLKLSVVSEETAQDLIPNISRYANSQNKVSEADLFANHPFHRRVEEISRRVWAPQRAGETYQTHWFYERARAQYQTERLRLTASQRKRFELQNPKGQVITKTDLAKYENTWARLPHVVSLGAQKNFSSFAQRIAPEWETRSDDFNERWFQDLVAKAILFKATEHLVSEQPWYQGGYRANIVTYALALLAHLTEGRGRQRFDLDHIWKAQRVPTAVKRQLELTARAAFDNLVDPPKEYSNVTEWAKKERVWMQLRETPVALLTEMEEFLVDVSEARAERKTARAGQRQDDAIALVTEVVNRGQRYWRSLLEWNRQTNLLTDKQRDLVALAARSNRFVPTDAQAPVLIEASARATEEGFK